MNEPASPESLPTDLLERLRAVRSVGVITGAGISKESGIPTYRGSGGVYDDPAEGDRTIESLSGPTFQRDPDRTWRTLAALAQKSLGAEPNAGHHALRRIEESVESFTLLTQNVDGLHRRAGSRNIIEIHGTIARTRCLACDRLAEVAKETLAAFTAAPRCACGGILRPDVVLFGEMLPEPELRRLYAAFHEETPDLVLTVGTSALFPYIVEPTLVAARRGSLTVEVNPERTEVSEVVDFHLEGPAGLFLPLLADVWSAEEAPPSA